METGQRGVSARDIRDLATLYQLNAERRQQLADLAAEGKQQASFQKGDLKASDYVGVESAAATISDFGHGLVPGLLQTADYARAVLQMIRPSLPDEVIEDRVTSRLERQRRILLSSNPVVFEALIDEAVLHRVVGSPNVMSAQLRWLVEVSLRPNVVLRLLRYDAGALPSNNKFIILTFAEAHLPDLVFIEGLLTDHILDSAHDVAVYAETFAVMKDISTSPEQTRELISDMATAFSR
jgi:hypothetical protein